MSTYPLDITCYYGDANYLMCRNDPSEKTIIFSQWTSLLDLLEVPIFRKGWGYRRYDGTMTSTERNDAIIDFTDDPSVNVMLVSLKAGNSGLNLVAASQVILFDSCYNPYVEDQAIDRAHRIGQQRPVVVHKLSIRGTVEDKVLALQEEKKAVIGSALDESASKGIARLGARDLAFLFVSILFSYQYLDCLSMMIMRGNRANCYGGWNRVSMVLNLRGWVN